MIPSQSVKMVSTESISLFAVTLSNNLQRPEAAIFTNLYFLSKGMTNYCIDRIGTDFDHIDSSTRQNRGMGMKVYKSNVSRYEYWANGNW